MGRPVTALQRVRRLAHGPPPELLSHPGYAQESSSPSPAPPRGPLTRTPSAHCPREGRGSFPLLKGDESSHGNRDPQTNRPRGPESFQLSLDSRRCLLYISGMAHDGPIEGESEMEHQTHPPRWWKPLSHVCPFCDREYPLGERCPCRTGREDRDEQPKRRDPGTTPDPF